MPAKKGEGHPKAGGRRKGTPNKDKAELLVLIRAARGVPNNYHPVTHLAQIANDKTTTMQIRQRAAIEVAQYISPRLKAIEHSGEIKNTTLMAALMEAVNGT